MWMGMYGYRDDQDRSRQMRKSFHPVVGSTEPYDAQFIHRAIQEASREGRITRMDFNRFCLSMIDEDSDNPNNKLSQEVKDKLYDAISSSPGDSDYFDVNATYAINLMLIQMGILKSP